MRFLILVLSYFIIYSSQAKDITILLAGDTMLGSDKHIISEKMFGESLPIFKNYYDILFFNYEATVGTKGLDDTNPKCISGKYCYTFMSDIKSLQVLSNLNTSSALVLNMANNHSNDYGSIVQKNTYLQMSQVAHPIGYYKDPAKELHINNQKIVFIGASPHTGSLSIFSEDLVNIVRQYKKKGYITVVSLHMGAEGKNAYWVENKNEHFAGQNRGNIYQLSRNLVDNGADIIVGHGPHVMRGIEKYKNKIIIYSLGNFLTYGQFSLQTKTAESVLIGLTINQEGNVTLGKLFGYQQTKTSYPHLWKQGVAIISHTATAENIKNLSSANFEKTFIFHKDNTFN